MCKPPQKKTDYLGGEWCLVLRGKDYGLCAVDSQLYILGYTGKLGNYTTF